MKRFAIFCIVLLRAFISHGQTLKGLTTIGVKKPVTAVSAAFSGSFDEAPTLSPVFRKDPFIVISRESKITSEEKNLLFKIKPRWSLLYSDAEVIAVDDDRHEKEKFWDLYIRSLTAELHKDPFYHVGRDMDPEAFIYEEQIWDALADTLKKKYRIIRVAENTARKLEDSVTLKYESKDGIKLKAKPGIESGDGQSLLLRCSIEGLPQFDRIDTRLSEDGLILRAGKELKGFPCFAMFYIEGKSVKSSDDEMKGKRDDAAQFYVQLCGW